MINLRLLEVLETVAQTGTFTGAAQRLHLTQSAVSHAVAELEQQAGAELFDRLPRGVRLTPCGALLLEESQAVLSACRTLESRMGSLETRAPVELASSITIACFWLPGILRRLRALIPSLRVHVRVASAANALDILQKGRADLALIEGAEPQGAQLVSFPFSSYRLCAACAPSFPLPPQPLTPRELCALPLLLREPGSAIRDTLDSALYLAGLSASPVWESVNSNALIEAARAGLGVLILPELLLKGPVSQGVLRPIALTDMDMENHLLAVRRKNTSPTHSLQTLIELIRSCESAPPASAV